MINNENTVIGKLGFAILISDKKELKIILYKSKTDLLSTLIVRETNKIFQKGKFIQYLDQDQNFWSVLFETDRDIEEAVRLLEERCTIECLTIDKEKMPTPVNDNDNDNNTTKEDEEGKSENYHPNFPSENGGCAVEMGSENDVKDKEGENDVTKKNNPAISTSMQERQPQQAETDSPNEDKSKQLKSTILSRMAKMGKRIVSPSRKLTTNNTELSDSSDPEVSPRRKQQLSQQRPHTTQNSPALQVAKLQPGPVAHSIEFMKHPPLINHHHTLSHSAGPASTSDSSLNLMLMQNTEIRFNLSKLDSKLDKLCDKIETMSANGSEHSAEDMVKIEEKLLTTKRENINLKMIIRNLEEKLNEPPDVELNELKIKLKTAQLELKNISLELNNKNEKIHLLEAKMKASSDEKETETTNMEVEINDLRSQLMATANLATTTTTETQTEQETVAFSEVMIKEIMNNLYFKLCEKISGSSDMKQSEVLKIIGQTIKHETGECLKKHFK